MKIVDSFDNPRAHTERPRAKRRAVVALTAIASHNSYQMTRPGHLLYLLVANS
jgi:hypothetical protein